MGRAGCRRFFERRNRYAQLAPFELIDIQSADAARPRTKQAGLEIFMDDAK